MGFGSTTRFYPTAGPKSTTGPGRATEAYTRPCARNPTFRPRRLKTTRQEARRCTRRGADDAKYVGLGLRQARPRELDPTGLSMSDTRHVLEYLFGFSIIYIEFWASGHDDAPAWAILLDRYDLSNIDNMDRSGGADDSYEPIDGQNDSPRLGTPISKRGAVKRGDTGAIHRALDAVDAKHREVLILHFLEEMPFADIAAVVDCPAGTVKSRVFYAKQALREILIGGSYGGT